MNNVAVAKTGMVTGGMRKTRLRDIREAGKTGLSDYLDSRMTGARGTLRMALRFLSDLGRMENLDIVQ